MLCSKCLSLGKLDLQIELITGAAFHKDNYIRVSKVFISSNFYFKEFFLVSVENLLKCIPHERLFSLLRESETMKLLNETVPPFSFCSAYLLFNPLSQVRSEKLKGRELLLKEGKAA